MKRVLAVLLTGVMAIGMTITAFAAESVEATDYVEVAADDVEVAEESETEVTIDYIYKGDGYYNVASALAKEENNETLASVTNADPDDYELAYLFEVTAETDETGAFAIYIEKGYSSVVVLHYNGSEWEPIETDYDSATGLLYVYADDYSPFAIYVSETSDYSYTASEEEEDEDADEEDEDADDEDEDADSEDEDADSDEDADEEESEGTSDETGEGTYVLYLVALAALAGLAVSAKMKRA